MFSISNLFLVALAGLALVAPTVDAHGYTTISRGQKCREGSNSGCGNIVFEPQSLEAPKGFPNAGPQDGQIASAGISAFSQLNDQSSTRWSKTNVAAGSYSFTWQHTANHATTGYQYFITRNGWNQNAPLTRASFESQPFCNANWNGSRPPMTVTHNCNLPSRSGYHVVLAVWTIADTSMAFYNMNDLNFGGGSTSPSGTCGGGSRGDGVCSTGECCSQYGWCGTTSDHCSGGGGGNTSPSGTCGGGSRGDGVCSTGECCSQYGWCGTTSAHCGGGGSSEPGTCGGGNRGNGRCANSALCCSQYGWCGTSTAHCNRRNLRSDRNSTSHFDLEE